MRDLEEAKRQLADAETDAERAAAEQAVAVAEAALTLDGNSEAALDNRDSMRDLADKIKRSSAEFLDLDKSGYTSRAEMERGRQKFIEVATQLGYTRDQAEEYADQLGLIPSEVPTHVYINGYEAALAKAQMIAATINGIDRDVAISIVTTETRREETYGSNSETGYQTGSATGNTRVLGERRAEGGWVGGSGSGRSDNVLTRLTPGEFVVGAQAAATFGPLLQSINALGTAVATMPGGINFTGDINVRDGRDLTSRARLQRLVYG